MENVEAVIEVSSALHCTMLLAKLCGLQTGMNLVVRIMCPPYTVRLFTGLFQQVSQATDMHG